MGVEEEYQTKRYLPSNLTLMLSALLTLRHLQINSFYQLFKLSFVYSYARMRARALPPLQQTHRHTLFSEILYLYFPFLSLSLSLVDVYSHGSWMVGC